MANGLLISYAGYPYALSSLFPDNGLASLAAVLRAEGHACQILDYNTPHVLELVVDQETRQTLRALLPQLSSAKSREALATLAAASRHVDASADRVVDHITGQVEDLCRGGQVDFVGFKLWSGDGFEASVKIANRLRSRFPGIKIFAGGPAVHYSGAATAAEAPAFDAIVDGDGEEAMVQLARFSEGRIAIDGVPNLVSESTQASSLLESDLAALPLPEYGNEVYPSLAAGAKLRMFTVDESRGCPMRCAFCINWCIEGSRWRTRSVDQIVQQIKGFTETSKSRFFRLAGTYSPPKLVRQICTAIDHADLKVQFSVSLHAAGVSQDLLLALREAGCFGVFFGAESGSDEILESSMHKRVDAAGLEQAIRASLDCGLFTVASFIVPAPHETKATEATTRKFISSIFTGRDNGSVLLNFPGLLPRTGWWQEMDRYGFELETSKEQYRRLLLHYKIQHILPPSMWAPLPYRILGAPQTEAARRTGALQAWVQQQGICVNLPDHDAQIGQALGYSASDFKEELRRLVFTGDSEGMWDLIARSNHAAAP